MQKINGDQILCFSIEEGLDAIFKIFSSGICGKPSLVEIAGPSCSGKTYLANRVVEKFLGEMGIVTSQLKMDSYFKDIDDSTVCDAFGRINFDWPGAYHISEFQNNVRLLIKGKDIMEPDYDIQRNRRRLNSGKLVKASWRIIAEGLYAIDVLQGIHTGPIKVFIDVDKEIQLQRMKQRNIKYGISELAIETTFHKRIYPCQEKFVEPQKKMADIVIVNNFEKRRGD